MQELYQKKYEAKILILASSMRQGGESKFLAEFTNLHPEFFFEIVSPDRLTDSDSISLAENTILNEAKGGYAHFFFKILRLVLSKKYDLLFVSGRKAGFVGHPVGNIFRLPIIYIPHGNHYLDSQNFFDKFYKKFDSFFLKKAFVYLISFAEKARYEKNGIFLRKFSIIRNPIFIKPKKQSSETEKSYDIYLFWIGRWDPHKDLKKAIDYVNKFAREVSDKSIKLDVYSTPPKDIQEENYYKECMSMQSRNWDLIKGEEVCYSKFKAKYTALFFTSKGEGFSYVIAESIATNIPIIAINSHGVSEVVGKKRGFLISNFQDFLKAIEKVNEKSHQIIENQRRFSERFLSVEYIKERQKKIIRQSIKNDN
ncbi:glycosyltransferase family 4 protein [Pseudomonadota bacterium]|nr:glycosyltransferase family 4 protein [Pseudomonadota bacterium]